MLQIKFHQNWPTGLRDIQVSSENYDKMTESGRTRQIQPTFSKRGYKNSNSVGIFIVSLSYIWRGGLEYRKPPSTILPAYNNASHRIFMCNTNSIYPCIVLVWLNNIWKKNFLRRCACQKTLYFDIITRDASAILPNIERLKEKNQSI